MEGGNDDQRDQHRASIKGKKRAKPLLPNVALAVVAQRLSLPPDLPPSVEERNDELKPILEDEEENQWEDEPTAAHHGIVQLATANPSALTNPNSNSNLAITAAVAALTQQFTQSEPQDVPHNSCSSDQQQQYEDDERLAMQLSLELNGGAEFIQDDDYATYDDSEPDLSLGWDASPVLSEIVLASDDEEKALDLTSDESRQVQVALVMTEEYDRLAYTKVLESYCNEMFQQGMSLSLSFHLQKDAGWNAN